MLKNILRKNTPLPDPTSVLISGHGTGRISESYKAIRTNIMHLLKDSESKTILVTSPYANAGKTTTTANLAITFAQLGKKVLMIDADMRRPSLHRLFSVVSDQGLSNVLTGSDYATAIMPTKYENLFILPAGCVPKNPSELLLTPCFSKLLAKLSAEYDTIFIDAPPVDAVTDSVIISQKVTGTILVIRQNHTEKEALLRTINMLNSVNANLLGYVLNAVDYNKFSYRYGHYYGNYSDKYSSYYADSSEESSEK
ncbi:MAG: CpsD/CapB family tyrosine-protein kinase [Clostridia bacterium]|nr:CpsD/CapB family tyrosine-protein kinase [Clostridia bacterium]